MNKKILLTVVAGSFFLAMILVGCGADRTTGTVTEGIIEKPATVPTSSASGGEYSSASEGTYCYVSATDYCYSMSEYSITASACTANGGSVVDSCN